VTEADHDHEAVSDETAAADGNDASHDDHDSLAEIVPLLQQNCDAVREAFAAGNPDQADEPIHTVAHLCKHIPEAANAAGLDAAAKTELLTATNKLFDAFEQIHAGFHDGTEGKTYEEVSASIEEAMTKLKELTPQSP
jgi:hypothetical protein